MCEVPATDEDMREVLKRAVERGDATREGAEEIFSRFKARRLRELREGHAAREAALKLRAESLEALSLFD